MGIMHTKAVVDMCFASVYAPPTSQTSAKARHVSEPELKRVGTNQGFNVNGFGGPKP